MKIKVPHLGLSSQVPKQKIRWSQGTADKVGSQPMGFLAICSSCLLIIGEMSLEQGPSPHCPSCSADLCPQEYGWIFWKETPPALHPWLSRSHLGSRSLSLKMVTFLPVLPEAVNFWVVQCHSSCGVWFQAAAVIHPGMPCFLRGRLFYCLVCVKEGPCSKRQRRCSGLLLFSLFLLLF